MVVLGHVLLPPSARLPPISKFASASLESLAEALSYLRLVYNPEVRGSRRVKKAFTRDSDVPNAREASDTDMQADLNQLRLDAYERSYAIRWLTGLLSYANTALGRLESDFDSESEAISRDSDTLLVSQYEAILAVASSLLATCAGASAAGVLTRVFTFPSVTGDITVTLTDAPLENHNFESVGAQTWGGACILSELIAEQPETFGLGDSRESGGPLRVLELGAGTGLVSLTLGKLLENYGIVAEIVATDFYPLVLANLQSNISANFLRSPSTSVACHVLDWSIFPTIDAPPPPFDLAFDVILGADIVYEPQHAIWIKQCLRKLLRKPGASDRPVFHLVIPLRPTHAIESRTIDEVFPVISTRTSPGSPKLDLATLEKEVIVCEAGEGKRGEEVEYAYYKIGWGVI